MRVAGLGGKQKSEKSFISGCTFAKNELAMARSRGISPVPTFYAED
jgi:hypothetical protein